MLLARGLNLSSSVDVYFYLPTNRNVALLPASIAPARYTFRPDWKKYKWLWAICDSQRDIWFGPTLWMPRDYSLSAMVYNVIDYIVPRRYLTTVAKIYPGQGNQQQCSKPIFNDPSLTMNMNACHLKICRNSVSSIFA